MLLHGHTDETLDGLSAARKLTILSACKSGLVGPLALPMHGSRILSGLMGVSATVATGLSGKRSRAKFKLAEEYPELHSVLVAEESPQPGDPEEVAKAKLGRKLARQAQALHSAFAKLGGDDGETQ